MEGTGVFFSASDVEGSWPTPCLSTFFPSRLASRPACRCVSGRRPSWSPSGLLASSSLPPGSLLTNDCETDRESSSCGSPSPPPMLVPPLRSSSTTMAGSDGKDTLEWSSPSLPALDGVLSGFLPIFNSLSFAFFRNPEKDCLKLMSSQDQGRWQCDRKSASTRGVCPILVHRRRWRALELHRND